MVNGVTNNLNSYQTIDSISKPSSTNHISSDKAYGKVVGEPTLSKEGLDYYEKLKAKYSDMDFVLVSKDKIDYAKQHAASYGSSKAFTVLIDDEKIEKMATDDNFRKKYEGLIEMAKTELPKMKEDLMKNGSSVVSYGMQVNDNGTASYFAVVDKFAKAQSERIERNKEKKKEENLKTRKQENEKWFDKHREKIVEDKKAEADKELDAAISRYLTGPSPSDKLSGMEDNRYLVFVTKSYEDLRQRLEDSGYIPVTQCILAAQEKIRGSKVDTKI